MFSVFLNQVCHGVHHTEPSLQPLTGESLGDGANVQDERIIRVEHGSFTPIVLSAFGFGYESGIFIKKLIEKLAEKRGDEKSIVENYVKGQNFLLSW